MTEFCLRLKELRVSRAYAQRELAEMIGISLRAYQRYESGDREPGIPALIKLADFYGISIDELLGRTDLSTL